MKRHRETAALEKHKQDIIDWLELVDLENAQKDEPICLMPRFIINRYLKKLSPSAWKVFCFLNSRANLVDWAYGKCVASYIDIENGTGVKVSHMSRYIKELSALGLIERKMLFTGKELKKRRVYFLFEICWYHDKEFHV